MPSSWPIYSYIIFAAVLGVLIPLGLRMTVRTKKHLLDLKDQVEPRTYLRFFLGASVSTLLLSGILLLLPVVTGFQGAKKAGGERASLVIITLLIFLVIGLFYSVKKGELSWKKEQLEEKGIEG